MMEQTNRTVLQQMVERRAGQLLDSTDSIIASMFNGNPAMAKMANSFITAKKKEYLPKIQEYVDLLVETSCLDPDISLEQAVVNAETSLNEFINQFLADKLGVDSGIVQISLSTLFGNNLFKF